MRLTIVALFVVFAGLAYAADMQPAGTAESEARAEQAAAAQAERDAARAAKEAAERRAALEEAERQAAAEAAERAAREEAERQAAAEAAERAAREEAERQAAERAARAEAERQAAAEAAERAAREEAERQAAERAAREEAERQAAAEAAERAAREEAERQAAERAAREEAERQAAAEAAERAPREEAERQAAAERAARDEAERQAAAEAAERAAREEVERQAAAEAAERAAREEAERQAAERAAREKAERQPAAEAAERAAKEQAEREAAQKAAGEASGQAAQATVMSLGDMDLAGSAAVCNLPVTIRDEAAARAIADRARSDAEAHAAAPARLIIVAQESVASLASAHALDQGTVSRAYFNGICQQLAEMGARLPLALGPLLANLADTLGVTYRSAKGVARLTTRSDSGAPSPAETAQDDSEQLSQPRQTSPGATPEAGEPDVAAAAAPDEAEDRAAPAANGDATPPGGGPETAASDEAPTGDTPQPAAPMATPAAGNGSAPGTLGEAECRALGVLGNCPDLNAVLDQLLEKPLEYNHPGEMLLGRNAEISLVLRTDWEGDDLPKEVSEEFKDLPGEVKQGISKITRIMSAELTGRSFDIQPTGIQERSVVPPQPVSWRWQVKPSETGKDQTLRLRLYAHLQGPQGTMPPILVKTLDATINVDVTPWDWMVSQARMLEPIYAIGAALIGLLTVILTFLLARRRREAYADGPAPEPRAAHTGPDPDGAVTDAGPVIGDVSQSAADSRPPAAPPSAEAEAVRPEPPPAEDGSETPPDNDSGPKTS